jgi:septum formation protein
MEGTPNIQTTEPARDDLSNSRSQSSEGPTLPRVVLASGSPRRAEILRILGWPFEARVVNIDESRMPGEDAATYVQRLAREKAMTAAAKSPGMTVVGADTTVTIDDHILEKPADDDDARRMLRLLNGRWHRVLTGLAVVRASSDVNVSYETTEVKFAAMSDDEIAWYVSTGEPMDKAGAYAIQGFGARFIEGIKGDYFNVMGLPARRLYELVAEGRP